MTTPTPDRTPTGDLHERLAEALYRWTTEQAAGGPARLLTRDETVLWENSLARADAVMHVIEPEILAVQVDATQRADELAGRLQEAERQRDEALATLHAFVDDRQCDPHPGNGFCQTHSETPPCPHAAAKKLLALNRPEEASDGR